MTDFEIALSVVSRATGVSRSKILSTSRSYHIAEARRFIIYLLHSDGYNDEVISWLLKRTRVTILRSRHYAIAEKEHSKLWQETFNKIRTEYDRQKSLRIS